MSTLDNNKEAAAGFYEMAFNDKKPAQAVEKYVGDRYIQHNPLARDGSDAFVEFVTRFGAQFPESRIDIKRIVAEGDLVVTHALLTTAPGDRGMVAADIFRFEDGKIVEHWDVVQPFPETSVNDHPMF